VGAIGRAWRPQLDAVRASHTVIALDNRGIGASTLGDGPLSIEAMAADALAVADAAGATRFHLVGHSMGHAVPIHSASTINQLLLDQFARDRTATR